MADTACSTIRIFNRIGCSVFGREIFRLMLMLYRGRLVHGGSSRTVETLAHYYCSPLDTLAMRLTIPLRDQPIQKEPLLVLTC